MMSDERRTHDWMRSMRPRIESFIDDCSSSRSRPAWPAIAPSGERKSCEAEAVNASSSWLVSASR